MGLQSFLDDNSVTDLPPDLVAAFDSIGAPLVTATYAVGPAPPAMSVGLTAVAGPFPPPGPPALSVWLALIELDIILLIHTVLLAGAVSKMALGPPVPAVPITPVAQILNPSLLLSPIVTDAPKMLNLSKAIMEWAISLIPPGDVRIAGTFTVIAPPAPSLGALIPAALTSAAIAAIIGGALANIPDSDDVDKVKIRSDVMALTAGSSPATVDDHSGFDDADVAVAVPRRGEVGSNPANDCTCD